MAICSLLQPWHAQPQIAAGVPQLRENWFAVARRYLVDFVGRGRAQLVLSMGIFCLSRGGCHEAELLIDGNCDHEPRQN